MNEYRIVKYTYKYDGPSYVVEYRPTLFGIPIWFWSLVGIDEPYAPLAIYGTYKDAKKAMKHYQDKPKRRVIK